MLHSRKSSAKRGDVCQVPFTDARKDRELTSGQSSGRPRFFYDEQGINMLFKAQINAQELTPQRASAAATSANAAATVKMTREKNNIFVAKVGW